MLTACICKARHACCLVELHMCMAGCTCTTSPVTPDLLPSLMHNGTGKNHFAGVTCIPALHTQPALAACCYKDPVLLLPLLCMHCCSLTPSQVATASQACCCLPKTVVGNVAMGQHWPHGKPNKEERILHDITVQFCGHMYTQHSIAWCHHVMLELSYNVYHQY